MRAQRYFPLPLAIGALLAACDSTPPQAHFLTEVPWSLGGVWQVADLHTHTRYSDGALAPGDLARLALDNGCTALAITDHGDLSVQALSDEFIAEFGALSRDLPLTLLAGLEWNIPPYNGREHVGVLVPPAAVPALLREFRTRFEASEAKADEALRWLGGQAAAQGAVLIYNHPSRKDEGAEENSADLAAWRKVNALVSVLEGGPGHQKAASPGDYRGKFRTEQRWDPAVARIGGTWDQALARGENLWGALASSDYHGAEGDHPPCAFARTHVHAPNHTPEALLRALRAGAFWAEHGRVLERLEPTLTAPGLDVPARPGEIVGLPAGVPLTLQLRLARGPGAAGKALGVEIIGNSRNGRPELLHQAELAPGQDALSWQPGALVAGADGRSVYFRVRVSAEDGQGGRWMAYANPVRVVLE